MKKITIIVVLLIAVVAAVYMFSGGSDQVSTASPSPTVSVSPSVSPTATAVPVATTSPKVSPTVTATKAPTVKTFTVIGKSFSFVPAEITVNKGDTVKIIFQNTGGNHDWVIDEFNARTNVINGGQSQTIQFVADKTGTFEYYCSVGTHRQMGMRGNLIVK